MIIQKTPCIGIHVQCSIPYPMACLKVPPQVKYPKNDYVERCKHWQNEYRKLPLFDYLTRSVRMISFD